MIGWLLVFAGWYFALTFHWSIGIPAALITIWKLHSLWFYYAHPWKRVHYPLMRIYASVSGLEQKDANLERREFSIDRAILQFVSRIHTDWNEKQAEAFIKDSNLTDDDVRSVCNHALKKGWTEGRISTLKEFLGGSTFQSDNGARVRRIIAKVIDSEHGRRHRDQYILEISTGRAG